MKNRSVMNNPPKIPVVFTSLIRGSSVFFGRKLHVMLKHDISSPIDINSLISNTIRSSIAGINCSSWGVSLSMFNAISDNADAVHNPIMAVSMTIILVILFILGRIHV